MKSDTADRASGDIRHQHQIDNINARTCWETIGLRGQETITILVVESDLILDADTIGFDAILYQDLVSAVREYLEMQTHIDTVAFYPMDGH